MKQSIAICLLILLSIHSVSFSQILKKDQDRESIKKMCGCFEVEFKFSETFNYSTDSFYMASKNKVAHALEYAQLVEENDDLVVIQHLLLIGNESKPHVMKHWRQDWLFENKDFYLYAGDNQWDYINKKEAVVAGSWTQKVYQVDDSPRYEGNGSWVYVDGKTYWENETRAPLPRREYTKRSDYNITLRRNKHIIIDEGWIHDQDNDKILREKRKDVVIAQEKGTNTYKRVADERCLGALTWWEENENFWSLVRSSWSEIYGNKKDLELFEKVDGKRLYEILFALPIDTDKDALAKILKSFVK